MDSMPAPMLGRAHTQVNAHRPEPRAATSCQSTRATSVCQQSLRRNPDRVVARLDSPQSPEAGTLVIQFRYFALQVALQESRRGSSCCISVGNSPSIQLTVASDLGISHGSFEPDGAGFSEG